MSLRCTKSTRRLKRIIVLWTLLLFQLFLIAVFVGFGSDNNNEIDDGLTRVDAGSNEIIQFVTEEKKAISVAAYSAGGAGGAGGAAGAAVASTKGVTLTSNADAFQHEFVNCYKNPENNDTIPFYCFRNGSIEPSQIFNENDIDGQDCTCKCQPKYHGKDCGQPEVVWRAFMATRLSRTNVGKTETALQGRTAIFRPPQIFYLIEATALSLTTMEMQMMELNDLVDQYILCDQINNGSANDPNSITSKDHSFWYHQTAYQHPKEFFLKQLEHKILIVKTTKKCTPKFMYKSFRSRIDAVARADGLVTKNYRNDVLLFSRADEILNRQAVAYIKWYNDWSQAQPIRFRLKYTVYGFYWQHPHHTVVASAACQLQVLDELYGGDPERLTTSKNAGMIIGDLNHFGGWFCQYCYDSPISIVQKLQLDKDLNVFEVNGDTKDDDKSLKQKRPAIVDSNYIQSLISAGWFVDGKTNLLRLHRYSDKYYAPDYVTEKSWKYESMLTNVYAHYDNDIEEDE